MTAERPVPARRGISDKLFNGIVLGAVALGFLGLVALGLLAASVVQRNLRFTDLVNHTYQVEQAIADYAVLNERVETARRGYLLAHDPSFLQVFKDTADALPVALERLDHLTADNPSEHARVDELKRLLAGQLRFLQESVALASHGGQVQAIQRFRLEEGVRFTRRIRAVTQQMALEEQHLLAARNAERLNTVNTLVAVMVLAGLLLGLVGAGSLAVIFRYTRDLTASRNELRVLNEGLEDTVRARTEDLQRANDEIQRFAYIVSHDLRSPLVNVMGFTSELEAAAKPLGVLLERAEAEAPAIVTDDARRAVREDVPESISFIRTSTQKMDRLINAILRLSREGRRVLTPEPLQMDALLRGVADNLKHRSEELGATIEVEGPMPRLVSDRLAVEQIFANLTENALKYLKPGRPGQIVLRGHAQGGRALFEVSDNGRGIDPKDHQRIFDLFRRSGAQDQPGEGIGLAHVRTLAYRLGGTVTCESALDQGATFRVSLPLTIRAEGAAP